MNTIFFDIETQNTFQELGMYGYKNPPSKLKLAIAGILFDNNNTYKFFGESQVSHLFNELKKADLIIGHNIIRFDYPCIQQYFEESIISILHNKTFDTMLELEQYCGGNWTSLDDLCKRNLGEGKSNDGSEIPQMWRNNQFKEVENYLLNDLMKTRDIYKYIKNNKKVKYMHKNYGVPEGEREVKVDW